MLSRGDLEEHTYEQSLPLLSSHSDSQTTVTYGPEFCADDYERSPILSGWAEDEDVSVQYSVPYSITEWTKHAQEEHDDLVKTLLTVEDEDDWLIPEYRIDNTGAGSHLSTLLEEYGSEDKVAADGGTLAYDPEDIKDLYAFPEHLGSTDIPSDIDSLLLEEAKYHPLRAEDGVSRHPNKRLRRKGELDVGRLTLDGGDPTAAYTEVKSCRWIANAPDERTADKRVKSVTGKAKKQLRRFAHFAQELGWETELNLAFYDDVLDHIVVASYDYDPS